MAAGELGGAGEGEAPYAHALGTADREDGRRLRLPAKARHLLLLRVGELVRRPLVCLEIVHGERVIGESGGAEEVLRRRVEQPVRLHRERDEPRGGRWNRRRLGDSERRTDGGEELRIWRGFIRRGSAVAVAALGGCGERRGEGGGGLKIGHRVGDSASATRPRRRSCRKRRRAISSKSNSNFKMKWA